MPEALPHNGSNGAAVPVDKPRNRGGRPLGSRNKVSADLKELIRRDGRPIETLIDISRGRRWKVRDAADPARGGATWEYPTGEMRMRAAIELADRIMPKLRSTELTGDPDNPLVSFQFPADLVGAAIGNGRSAAEFTADDDDDGPPVIDADGYPAMNGNGGAHASAPPPPKLGERHHVDDVSGAFVELTAIGADGTETWKSRDWTGATLRTKHSRSDAEHSLRQLLDNGAVQHKPDYLKEDEDG